MSTNHDDTDPTPPCPCECNSGGFCGGCGHAGCGGRLFDPEQYEDPLEWASHWVHALRQAKVRTVEAWLDVTGREIVRKGAGFGITGLNQRDALDLIEADVGHHVESRRKFPSLLEQMYYTRQARQMLEREGLS